MMQLLENENEFIIHGFAYRDWIREIASPNLNVANYGPEGAVDLNRAMSVVYNEVSLHHNCGNLHVHAHDIIPRATRSRADSIAITMQGEVLAMACARPGIRAMCRCLKICVLLTSVRMLCRHVTF